MMKKALLYIIGVAAAMTSCVSYEAEDFTGHTLPRKTGYSTGVTNDWLYFDLKTGPVSYTHLDVYKRQVLDSQPM